MLCRFTLLDDQDEGAILVHEMHHSIYDGYSHVLLLDRLGALIEQHRQRTLLQPPRLAAKYEQFINYLSLTDQKEAQGFWSRYLDGVQPLNVPIIRKTTGQTLTNARKERDMSFNWNTSAFTTATYLRAAFSLLLTRYAASADVHFAATINGRDLPVDGIDELAGPTFATIPVRVNIDHSQSLSSLLSAIQQDSADCVAHQTLPTEDISRINEGCKEACKFKMHLLVQNRDTKAAFKKLKSLGYEILDNQSPLQMQIPFNIVATVTDDGMHVESIYDDSVVMDADMELFLDQMEAVLQIITQSGEDVAVEEILAVGKKNQEIIMSMQHYLEQDVAPASTIPDLVFRNMDERAEREALYTSDASLSYEEFLAWAHEFAEQISRKLTTPRQMIAFCYDKTVWAIVAQMSIMLAGLAFVPIDPSWPVDRRNHILQQTESPLIVTSTRLSKSLADSNVEILVLDEQAGSGSANAKDSTQLQHSTKAEQSDIAYCLYTSGSTGTPKGVVIEHGAVTRTLQAWVRRFNYSSETRALLFASFTFDTSIMETWSVLAEGGTVCVANEEERISDLSNFIERSKAGIVALTPTASGLVDSAQVTSVSTLVLWGEKCRESDLKQWRDCDVVLVNGYGPTEACIITSLNAQLRTTSVDDIGTTLAGGLWVVNPDNVDEILPVGCMGELVISGPVLAREYYKAPELTAERFVRPQWPKWTNLDNPRVYRTGDLVRADSDGHLHFLGRIEGQVVKINGIRGEIDEIEHAVLQFDAKVKEVLATVVSHGENADEIVVYWVPSDASGPYRLLPLVNGHRGSIDAMHAAAERLLPKAFVPSTYIPVSRIPFATSGKADRKLLMQDTSLLDPAEVELYQANPDALRSKAEGHQHSTPSVNGPAPEPEPLSDIEITLQSMWISVLRLPPDSSSWIKHGTHSLKQAGTQWQQSASRLWQSRKGSL